MISFSEYNSLVDRFFTDSSVISGDAFSRFVSEKNSEEYALLIPNANKESCPKIRTHFKKENHALYPIACCENKTPFRIYLLTKKPSMISEDFRGMLSDAYYSLKNFSVIYHFKDKLRILHNQSLTESVDPSSSLKYQQIISKLRTKKCEILGVEVPLNEDLKSEYRKNALLQFPLLPQEFSRAMVWKTIVK